MNETEAIVAAAEAARGKNQPAVLATVVRVRGSAYRRPGARMLLTPDGWQAGGISGGCLEGDVQRKAWWRTEGDRAVVVTYDSTMADDEAEADTLAFGFGLGCNGVVEVLLERIPPANNACCPIAFLAECLHMRRVGVLATVIAAEESAWVGCRLLWRAGDSHPRASSLPGASLSARIADDARRVAESGEKSETIAYATPGGVSVEVFLERVAPPTPLVICGAGHDAIPLAAMAKAVGWHVTVVDPRPGAVAHPDRFPGADCVLACAPADLPARVALGPDTLAVVMSHNVTHDGALLGALLPSPARYLGVLGPRRRTERLLASLPPGTASPEALARLHAPLGLDLGGETPEAIALAALGEMQAVLAGRAGGFLRERNRPIHDPAPPPTVWETTSVKSSLPREPVLCALTTTLPA